MVSFAGFYMPVEYSGIVGEHQSVRKEAGIFDVSHMGEISVTGEDARGWLNQMTTNDVSKLALFQGQYTTVLNDRGGVIDDLIVYKRADDYLLVPNASNSDRVFQWLVGKAAKGVRLENQTRATGQIAVQGPKAFDLVGRLLSNDVSHLGYFHSMLSRIGDVDCFISRTGYTGEDGFEIYMDAAKAERVWDLIMDGSPRPQPCGLGARDTLRLEMAYRLHGSDMDETTTPLEAGLGWVVKMDKGDFVGKEALRTQTEHGVSRRLIGLRSDSRRVPRHGCPVVVEGKEVGKVTSGGFSPSLQCGIALAYVDSAWASRDRAFKIDVRGQLIDAAFEKGPFYKKASHK
jgi:aminomethyltransferase